MPTGLPEIRPVVEPMGCRRRGPGDPPVSKDKVAFVAAGIVFAGFLADIMIAKVQVLSGVTIPVHLGDTLQFLILFLAVALFVIGTLAREKMEEKMDKGERETTATKNS